jgi:maleamate amidohydrolase
MLDNDVFVRQKYGKRLGFGTSPALLIIDCLNGFKDPALFGSAEMVNAMAHTRHLLEAARNAGITVAYSRHMFAKDGSDLGVFGRKVPAQAILTDDHPSSQIADELAPRPGEIIIRKRHPSAFFATDLAQLLHLRGIDTAIITGCSTSGCVHATVVDAMGYGLRPIIVRECVGDRHDLSHQAALLNIDMKYGDVVELKEAIRHLKGMSTPSLVRSN